jgi:hypothetical protein
MIKVKDLPLGILMIVISFFPFFLGHWLANTPDALVWFGIVSCVLSSNIIFNVGWKIAFQGVDIPDDQK